MIFLFCFHSYECSVYIVLFNKCINENIVVLKFFYTSLKIELTLFFSNFKNVYLPTITNKIKKFESTLSLFLIEYTIQ